jgi:hypothetical protein
MRIIMSRGPAAFMIGGALALGCLWLGGRLREEAKFNAQLLALVAERLTVRYVRREPDEIVSVTGEPGHEPPTLRRGAIVNDDPAQGGLFVNGREQAV